MTNKPRKKPGLKAPLRDAPRIFWNVLFPEAGAYEATIREWVINRLASLHSLDATADASSRSDFEIVVEADRVELSFPRQSNIDPMTMKLFAEAGLMEHHPAWEQQHPIARMLANPAWPRGRQDVHTLFRSTVGRINERVSRALLQALREGRLKVWAARSDDLHSPDRIPPGLLPRVTNIRIAGGTMEFEPGAPFLVRVEIEGPGSEGFAPGKSQSLEKADEPFVEEMYELMKSTGIGITAASLQVAKKAPGRARISESKARRIRNRFLRKYPNWERGIEKFRREAGLS
ncbi:MAG: hypothetical protein JNK84_14480 [Phreatobacter sp.]|uniref:hypothetical protein n=1 Tax=Phreatobacter sp. TaxID=1966341 RepID=UPI001A4F409D|nr:hypothetical protein [Phreatobacter sp.]MBL8570272.1 hypothetical protein [Phreatobacter sp.]